MKIISLLLLTGILIGDASCQATQKIQDTSKWQRLFNGKDITDWTVKIQHHEVNENFGNTFRVEDGIIKDGMINAMILMTSLATCIITQLSPGFIWLLNTALLVNNKRVHHLMHC